MSGAKLLNTVIINSKFSNLIVDTYTDFSGSVKVDPDFLKYLQLVTTTNITLAELCRKYNLKPNVFYGWKQKFIEGGKMAFKSEIYDRIRIEHSMLAIFFLFLLAVPAVQPHMPVLRIHPNCAIPTDQLKYPDQCCGYRWGMSSEDPCSAQDASVP